MKQKLLVVTIFLFCGAAVAGIWSIRESGPTVHVKGTDDAYISYRYARNLVEGQGLVYNPGERVEGYSNFLFVLLSALLLLRVDPDAIYPAVCLLNLGFLLLALILFQGHCERSFKPAAANCAAVLLGLSPLLWIWTASGMETTLVVCLQIALWVALERVEDRRSGEYFWALILVMTLCILVRADGMLFVLLGLGYLFLRGRTRLAVRVTAAILPLLAGYFLWRWHYYGDWLPNTYYVKVSGLLGSRLWVGADRLMDLSLTRGFLPHLLLVLAAAVRVVLPIWIRKIPLKPLPLTFPVFFSVGMLGYWLYIGGDHFGERFLLYLFPMGLVTLLALGTPSGYGESRSGGLSKKWPWAALVMILFQLTPAIWGTTYSFPWWRYDPWIHLGKHLRTYYPDVRLAVDAAGKIPYFSGLETIDMRGLNDRHIGHMDVEYFSNPGHDKHDADYVLARQPDLIAGWIRPNLDVGTGLTRKRYSGGGYQLELLLNLTPGDPLRRTITVTHMPPKEIRKLIESSYRYALLVRRKQPPA